MHGPLPLIFVPTNLSVGSSYVAVQGKVGDWIVLITSCNLIMECLTELSCGHVFFVFWGRGFPPSFHNFASIKAFTMKLGGGIVRPKKLPVRSATRSYDVI